MPLDEYSRGVRGSSEKREQGKKEKTCVEVVVYNLTQLSGHLVRYPLRSLRNKYTDSASARKIKVRVSKAP
jgi:hypothetical protein